MTKLLRQGMFRMGSGAVGGAGNDYPRDAIINLGKHDKRSKPEIVIFCFDIGHCSRSVQFVVLTAAVFIFYLLYGYVQELMFRLEGFREFGWYLTLIQFFWYSVLGFGEMKLFHRHSRSIPLTTYLQLALYTVATMGLSNAATGHLNYPTLVIFKCCKLIPVLIGGIIIQGKRYGCLDVIAACCMSIGLVLFSLADNQVSPNFSVKGYVMISLALVADAVIGNVQEKAMKQHKASNTEVVLYSYSIGFAYILVGLAANGELWDAFAFCLNYPLETYGYAVIFSITGYLGVNVVLTLVKSFGALVAVTVTTCRKAVTIVLSFVFFSKPFTAQYVWSGLLVCVGIYLNVYSKNRVSWNDTVVQTAQRLISCYQKFRLKQSSSRIAEVV